MKKSTSILFFLLFEFLTLQVFAQQKITIKWGCNYASGQEGARTYTLFEPPSEINEIVKEVLGKMGIYNKTPFILKVSDVPNAMAINDKGNRYILVNATFLDKFKKDANTKWAAYALLAHEIAHHVIGHELNPQNQKQSHAQELEADQFSGTILARFKNITRDDALAGIRNFALPNETSTHPAKSVREQMLGIAFDEERKKINTEDNSNVVNKPLQIALDNTVFVKPNLVTAQNSNAIIDNEKVVISIYPSGLLKGHKLRICLKSSNSSVVPGSFSEKSVSGIGDTIWTGSKLSIVWNYRMDDKDNLSARQLNLLRVYVFDMDKKPPLIPQGEKAILAGIGAVGLGSVGYGVVNIIQGKDLYKLYRDVRTEDASEYDNESREDRYKRANKKYVTGQVITIGGAAILAGGIWWLRKKLKAGPRMNPKTLCFSPFKFKKEPLMVVDNGQARAGLMLWF